MFEEKIDLINFSLTSFSTCSVIEKIYENGCGIGKKDANAEYGLKTVYFKLNFFKKLPAIINNSMMF